MAELETRELDRINVVLQSNDFVLDFKQRFPIKYVRGSKAVLIYHHKDIVNNSLPLWVGIDLGKQEDSSLINAGFGAVTLADWSNTPIHTEVDSNMLLVIERQLRSTYALLGAIFGSSFDEEVATQLIEPVNEKFFGLFRELSFLLEAINEINNPE